MIYLRIERLKKAARTKDTASFKKAAGDFLAAPECCAQDVSAAYEMLYDRSLDENVLAHAYMIFAYEVKSAAPDFAAALPRDVPQSMMEFFARERARRLDRDIKEIVRSLRIPPEVRGRKRIFSIPLN